MAKSSKSKTSSLLISIFLKVNNTSSQWGNSTEFLVYSWMRWCCTNWGTDIPIGSSHGASWSECSNLYEHTEAGMKQLALLDPKAQIRNTKYRIAILARFTFSPQKKKRWKSNKCNCKRILSPGWIFFTWNLIPVSHQLNIYLIELTVESDKIPPDLCSLVYCLVQ